jgi:hypothetical protein
VAGSTNATGPANAPSIAGGVSYASIAAAGALPSYSGAGGEGTGAAPPAPPPPPPATPVPGARRAGERG